MTNHDDAYEAIAKKTGFEIPALYRKMVADGVTEYGADRGEWHVNPPALGIASAQVEWYAPTAIADYEPAEYWDRSLTLVPFAQNGGGDLWCFHPAAAENDLIPVALCPHDEMSAEIFAPDLGGFWFRQLLNAFAEMDVAHTRFDEATQQQQARAEIRTIARYVRPEWVAILEEVASRPMKRKGDILSFLSRSEAGALATATLAYARLGETFMHAP
ncbi:MAG: SMI1/KNR4 family protein [Labilithrix sp.]|nr:SMI1/KNR4 family protein [Labilithrix sp.]